jgi:hypothetical protein
MTMPKIADCKVAECSYNKNKQCHTLAITVGDGNCPKCDTFTKLGKKGGDPEMIAGVGSCRADNCKYNRSLECTAASIHVGMHSGHADCTTFSPK